LQKTKLKIQFRLRNYVRTKMDRLSKRTKLTFIYFCVMVALGTLQILYSVIPNTLSDNMGDILYTLCSQVLCMGILPFVLLLRLKPFDEGENKLVRIAKDFRYSKPFNKKSWLLLLPIAISFYLVTSLSSRLWSSLLSIAGFTFPTNSGYLFANSWDFVLWVGIVGVLPAIFEEFTHRGLLLDALEDRGNEWEMVLFSGLLFGGMHTNIQQFFYAFVGGCALAFVVIKTGSIFFSMIIHFFTNFISVFIGYCEYTDGFFNKVYILYNSIFDSTLSYLAYIAILIANLFLFFYLLSVVQKQNSSPLRDGIRPRKFITHRITLDTYRKDGKATFLDNAFLYGALAIGVSVTIFTLIYGYFR